MRKLLFRLFKKTIKLFSGHGLSRKWPISILYKFFLSSFKPDFVELDGHKIFLPRADIGDISHDISLFNTWGEKNEVNIFKNEIKKGNVVLDIGAHVGYYALLAAKLVGENGKVYAFEPDPRNFECLKKNVEQNGYKNVVCLNKAVSNRTGKTKLFFSEETDNSQIVNRKDGKKSVTVDVTTLDNFFENKNPRADFIKIDVEGAEGLALEGMTNLIKKNKNLKILTEFFPDRLKFNIGAKKYLEILEKYRFEFYDVNKKEVRNTPVTKECLLRTYLVGKEKFEKGRVTNLFCLRKK